jgi:hypothetical protein
MGSISWLKSYLSHVRDNTWHYKTVKNIWGKNTAGGSCLYYWIKLPTALVATALIAILFVIVATVAWFVGYILTDFKTDDPKLKEYARNHDAYPYGLTSKGKRRRIIPWQVTGVVIFCTVVWYLSFPERGTGILVGSVIGSVIVALLLLGIFVYAFSKSWNTQVFASSRAAVSSAWHRACPPLTVVPQQEPEPEDASTSD